jgi:hypothetical protein
MTYTTTITHSAFGRTPIVKVRQYRLFGWSRHEYSAADRNPSVSSITISASSSIGNGFSLRTRTKWVSVSILTTGFKCSVCQRTLPVLDIAVSHRKTAGVSNTCWASASRIQCLCYARGRISAGLRCGNQRNDDLSLYQSWMSRIISRLFRRSTECRFTSGHCKSL